MHSLAGRSRAPTPPLASLASGVGGTFGVTQMVYDKETRLWYRTTEQKQYGSGATANEPEWRLKPGGHDATTELRTTKDSIWTREGNINK